MSLPFAHFAGAFAPIEILPLTVAGILYWHRATVLSWDGRPVPAWRQACFGSGLAIVAISLFSPIGHIAEELVIAHMVEHLLIGDIATLLLVLGLTKSMLQPVLAIRAFNRLQILAHPLVAFPLWALNFYVWHIPVLYEAAYGRAPVHALEHAMLPLLRLPDVDAALRAAAEAGVVHRRLEGRLRDRGPLRRRDPRQRADVVGHGALPDLRARASATGASRAVADQSTAGVIMMIEGTFLALGVLAWVFFEVAREGIEKQRLLDLAHDRGVALDERRAQRAVAAGHGARLERANRRHGQ